MIESPSLDLFLSAIQTGSSVVFLGLMVWAFYSGKVIPRSTVDEMMETQRIQTKFTTKEIVEHIGDIVEKAVESGIERGMVAVKKMDMNND